jgi:hypothetical protein
MESEVATNKRNIIRSALTSFDQGQCASAFETLLISAIIETRWSTQNSMANSDQWKIVRRNKLIGMWAAEKLGITGQKADAYSNALALDAMDPERSDVLSKIRVDFEAAGIMLSDEEIVRIVNQFTAQAGNLAAAPQGDATDKLAVMLAQKLKPQ